MVELGGLLSGIAGAIAEAVAAIARTIQSLLPRF